MVGFISSHRYWMHAFSQPFPGQKGESNINIMKYIWLGYSHVIRYPSFVYENVLYHIIMKKICEWRVFISPCTMIHKTHIGSHSIISRNNSESAYLTLFNEDHILLWGAILWYKEIAPGVLTSRFKMTPAHQAIRSHRYLMFAFAQPLID